MKTGWIINGKAAEYYEGKPCQYGHTLRYASTGRCVVCHRNKNQRWKQAHPEQYDAAREDWFANGGKEKKAQADKNWVARNAQQVVQVRKKHYAENRSKILARNEAWRVANPDSFKVIQNKRRARKAQAEGEYSAEDVSRLLKEQEGCCAGCERQFTGRNPHTIDHIIPLSRGGSNWPKNIQLLCGPCNDSKGARTMKEWQRLAA